LLEVHGLGTGYGKKRVLEEVTVRAGAGEAIAILGHNGAGKTTLLRSIFGLQQPWEGAISFDGASLGRSHTGQDSYELGMGMIPAERFVFPDMTVMDNLLLSARNLAAGDRDQRIEAAFATYPIMHERRDQLAGTMSGGEQRMVSLSMALMTKPRLLLLDEPSLGLSPRIAQQLMARVRELVDDGMSVIFVEQNVPAALSVASRVYVLRAGRVIVEESAEAMAQRGRESWWELF
jgi:branched-chain amino acid transport system ATP-binding protein